MRVNFNLTPSPACEVEGSVDVITQAQTKNVVLCQPGLQVSSVS